MAMGAPQAHANSEEDVMAQAAEHAKSVHGFAQISEDTEMKVRSAIEDEDDGESGVQRRSGDRSGGLNVSGAVSAEVAQSQVAWSK
jgi:predicted small metal-binding protein